jgi:uncharacterized membrane protein SpoIIM required for sporulation
MKTNALIGAACGFFLGLALLHTGCDNQTFQSMDSFVFNVFGALFVAVVGLLIGWAIGDK